MKTNSFTMAHSFAKTAAVIAACAMAALPLVSKAADRDDQNRGKGKGKDQAPSRAPAPAPAPSRAPAAAPQRPQTQTPHGGDFTPRGKPDSTPRGQPDSTPRGKPDFTPRTDGPSSRPSGPKVITQDPGADVHVDSKRVHDKRDGDGSVNPRTGETLVKPRTGPGTVNPDVTPGSTTTVRTHDRDGRTTATTSASAGFPVVKRINRDPATVAAVQAHRHFTDTSRFSHIDRTLAFRSYPHHQYRLYHGNGYRGYGWYFGPPGFGYFYDYPGVLYFPNRDVIPQDYLSLSYSPDSSLDYAVQQALYDRGYYNGAIDGDIGPMSRMAIANFQADNGMEPTGIIDDALVQALRID